MGQVLLIGCNKGGSGKSTTAINCASALAQKGDVLLVCADTQPSAYQWVGDRAENNVEPYIARAKAEDNITKDLIEFRNRYDYVVVDVPGRNSRELVTGLFAADILIAPHQCSQFDLDTLSELEDQLVRAKDYNVSLRAYLYQAMASTNVKVREAERSEFVEISKEFNEVELLSSVGYYRRCYKQMIPEGKGATEWTNEEARGEILNLLEEVGL